MLERKGVPTVTLITSAFTKLAELQASRLGMADLPVISLPHPIKPLQEQDMIAIAHELQSSVVEGLTSKHMAHRTRQK